MAYQRNMLEDLVDHARENRVQQPEVAAGDKNEPQNDSRQCGDLLAVRPLNALELGPDVLEEVPDLTESERSSAAAAALSSPRTPRGPVAVSGAISSTGSSLNAPASSASSSSSRSAASLEVGLVRAVVVGSSSSRRRPAGPEVVAAVRPRQLGAASLVLGRAPCLGPARRAPGRLPLLRPLPVTGHAG